MEKGRKLVISKNEVSEVDTFELGGYSQKVLIEGRSKLLPVVIALHGGPGTPIPFCVGCRGLFPEITDKCILVCWDQYGCGANNAALPENIRICDFVNMTADLVDIMKERFPNNKLYLFGMSWGSVLAARAARLRENSVAGVFTYGQVLCDLMRSGEAIEALLNSKAPEKVKKEVKKLATEKSVSYESAMKMSGYIRKYTEGYTCSKEKKSPMGKMIKGIFLSPDYSFKDFLAIVKNGYMNNKSLVKELSTIDLKEDLAKVNVPYKILQGDGDIVTSAALVREFVRGANSPNLTCRVIENSAHMPGMNGMGAIMEEINSL